MPDMNLDPHIPPGPWHQKWDNAPLRLVAPNNRRKLELIVVGSGLAGASAGAALAEQGYRIHGFCYQDSPRRSNRVAAPGGINAAKNYQNDGDRVYRLFHDQLAVARGLAATPVGVKSEGGFPAAGGIAIAAEQLRAAGKMLYVGRVRIAKLTQFLSRGVRPCLPTSTNARNATNRLPSSRV